MDDDSSASSAKNWLAQPAAAGVITAGALLVLGGPGLPASEYVKQAAIGAGAVFASEWVQASMMGGKNPMVSPVVTAVTFAGISKAAGVPDGYVTLAAGGAVVDVASQWLGNPVASMLGL